ncbi:MAG: hypothetical protein U1E49_03340 [Hyphomicrobiaceae bacterium]
MDENAAKPIAKTAGAVPLIRWAMQAAGFALGAGASKYWLGIFWILLGPALHYAVLGTGLAIILFAIPNLWRPRWRSAVTAVAIVVLGGWGFWYAPWADVNVWIDLHVFMKDRDKLVELAQLPAPPLEKGSEPAVWEPAHSYKLPPSLAVHSAGGEFYIQDTGCGRYVFLVTFTGLPDGAGGFLYVPPCAKPEGFAGVLGSSWFHIERMTGNWYRIDGS